MCSSSPSDLMNTRLGCSTPSRHVSFRLDVGVSPHILLHHAHMTMSKKKFSWIEKVVTDLIDKEYDYTEQESSKTKAEVFALISNVLTFASRPKAKAKPRRPTSACSSTRAVPICERIWIDVEPGAQFDQAYPVAKRINTLLRHGELPREEDGAIEFWRLKDYLRNDFEDTRHWSDEMWKIRMAKGGGNQKIFQYCTDSSGQEILYLRALQGHSGRSPIDPSLQDNVVIPDNFFEYTLSHRMCNQFTLHHQFRIDTGRSKCEQSIDSILSACGSYGQGTHRSARA